MKCFSKFDEGNELIINGCVLFIFFGLVGKKSFKRSEIFDNLLVRIEYFGERVHGNVEVILFDRTGLFMELIIVTSQTVDRVD